MGYKDTKSAIQADLKDEMPKHKVKVHLDGYECILRLKRNMSLQDRVKALAIASRHGVTVRWRY